MMTARRQARLKREEENNKNRREKLKVAEAAIIALEAELWGGKEKEHLFAIKTILQSLNNIVSEENKDLKESFTEIQKPMDESGFDTGPTTPQANVQPSYGGFYGINDDLEDEDDDDLYVSLGKDAQRRIQGRATGFRHERYYGPDYEEKTCIWSGSNHYSWSEQTAGISWIGINGTDAACVVALYEKPLPPPGRTQLDSSHLLLTALCDMGVWADTTSATTEFRRHMMAQSSFEGPFAVVSVAPGTDAEDHQGARLAINFLKMKLNGREALAYSEMKQIAVCALKYLLGPKFDSNEIVGMGSGKADSCDFGAAEIQELLSGMNQT